MKPQPPKPRPSLDERVRAYMQHVDPAIAGQNGHNTTYRAACTLVVGFCLDEAQALMHLREWNARCSPAWSDKELERKIREAMKARGRDPSKAGALLGDVRDYARSASSPSSYTGPKAARSQAAPPPSTSGPQAARSSAAVPPPTSAPKAGRSLPFLLTAAAAPSPAPSAAEQAASTPSAPSASAHSLPASVLAAVRASVALWGDQSGETPDTLYVPQGVAPWPQTLDGMAVIEEAGLASITPSKRGLSENGRGGRVEENSHSGARVHVYA